MILINYKTNNISLKIEKNRNEIIKTYYGVLYNNIANFFHLY